jgi:hypothetical protein
MYQNLEKVAQSLPSLATDALSGDVRESLRTATLFESSLPKVVFVYGDQDRILAAARGSYGLRIASMLGLRGLMDAAGMSGLWH